MWGAAGLVALVLIGLVTWFLASGDDTSYTAQGEDSQPSASAPPQSPSPSADATEEPAPADSGAASQPAAPKGTVVNGVVLPEANVAPPVPFDKPAQIVPDFSASVTSVKAIDGVGQGIGEISGPALAFTVQLTNNTKAPLETVGVVVNCYEATTNPAIPLLGDPNAKPLPDTVAPGQTVTGVYVFLVPKDARDSATLTLAFDPESPMVVFSGKLPGSG